VNVVLMKAKKYDLSQYKITIIFNYLVFK
jgi:hypothetical protein